MTAVDQNLLLKVLSDRRARISAPETDYDAALGTRSSTLAPETATSRIESRPQLSSVPRDEKPSRKPPRPRAREHTAAERREGALRVRALMREGLTFTDACKRVAEAEGVVWVAVQKWCRANNVLSAHPNGIRVRGPQGRLKTKYEANLRARLAKERQATEEQERRDLGWAIGFAFANGHGGPSWTTTKKEER